MRSFIFALSIVAVLAFAPTSALALGDTECKNNSCNTDESVTNQGGTGVGVGVGVGVAEAEAEGGTGIGFGGTGLGFGGDQDQSQGQGQSQFGVNDLDADLSNRNSNLGFQDTEVDNEIDNRDYNHNSNLGFQDTEVDVSNGNGFGNFSPEADASSHSSAYGKQGQSQLGINEQGQANFSHTDTETSTEQSQSNSNSATGSGNVTKVDARDQSSTVYEAQERNPVSSAAPVSATACSSGLSAQGVDLGGAVAVTNVYCNLALTAEVAAAQGKTDVAGEMVDLMAELARADAKGVGGFRSFLRGMPILGGTLFRWVY